MQSSAVIYGKHRYLLKRIWGAGHILVVCMLNPSTADATKNDPTILTLIHFAKLWGYGGIWIVNEYAFRASKPSEMRAAADPKGRHNDAFLDRACEYAGYTSGVALVAWGNGCDGERFQRFAKRYRLRLLCLGFTQSGAPKHPLARGLHRIPRDQQPLPWSPK